MFLQCRVLPCCCVMFLLRLGEGRSHSALPSQLARNCWGMWMQMGWHRGLKVGMRKREGGEGRRSWGLMRTDAGYRREGNYTKILKSGAALRLEIVC